MSSHLTRSEIDNLIAQPCPFEPAGPEWTKEYFGRGFRTWNGQFVDELPAPDPIDPAMLKVADPDKLDWEPPSPAETFRPIDPNDEQDRLYAGILAKMGDQGQTLSSNVSNLHENSQKFPSLPPLVGVRCFKSNVELVRAGGEQAGGGKRAQCTEISQEQFKRAVRVLTDSEKELNSLLTVTYPDTHPWDGRIFKAHLRRFLERLREEVGDFDYFLAIEYQKRGAPHAHIGLSVDLSKLGDVVKVPREKGKRRSDHFLTVRRLNRLAFDRWRETIDWHNEGVIKHHGEELEWDGITEDDWEKMEIAFEDYNSGVSWEVMREKDGAKRYFVKELTGKKGNPTGWYQKSVPDGFEHPGRHFLNSRDFVNRNAVEFACDYDTLCWIVKESKLEHVPDDHKPLYKWLWNASYRVSMHLVKAGFRAISGLEYLRKYWDVRASQVAKNYIGPASLGAWSEAHRWARAARYWKHKCSRFLWDEAWEFSFANAPPVEI